ncbi:MAG: histidine kinase [Bacteroidales bacterium]
MKRFLLFLIRPWFPAMMITLVLAIMLPLGQEKYTTESTVSSKEPAYWEYQDLNRDGKMETIAASINENASNPYICILNSNNTALDQWNFSGSFPEFGNYLCYQDLNRDGKKEVLVLYHRNDSLFLLCINAYYNPGFVFRDLFITRVNKAFGKTLFNVVKTDWHDYNADGVSDLYILLFGSFAIDPRNIFRIDMATHEIVKSPLRYANISDFEFHDLDKDGKQEILLTTDACANIHSDTLPYNDRHCWLTVLDENLGFFLPPIRLHPYPTHSSNSVVQTSKGTCILTYENIANDSSIITLFSLRTPDGKLINSRSYLSENSNFILSNPKIVPDSLSFPYFINADGEVFSISESLNLTRISTIEKGILLNGQIQLPEFSEPVLVFYSTGQNKFILTRKNFKPVVSFKLDGFKSSGYTKFFLLSQSSGTFTLAISSVYGGYHIKCSQNPWFYLRFVLFLLIFHALLLLFRLLKKAWEKQVHDKNMIERDMLRLQLSSLSSQLDPHLTFNLLNSISYVLLKNEGKELHESFTRLTNYIRNTLVNSDRLIVSLHEEIEFVKSYLTLQKARLGDRLNWTCSIHSEIPDNIPVPRMVIQNLVENSIKHGLKPKEAGGNIQIEVLKLSNRMVLRVTDDGAGKSSLASAESTGKGLALIRQFYELLNRVNTEKAQVSLSFPMNASGQPLGAVAEVTVPLEYKYQ